MTKDTILKAKKELENDLKELTELENKVKAKRSDLKYQKMEVPFQIGSAYFIRTVTYFATGKVKAIVGQFLVLDDAAWIADTGRFSDAIAKGVMSEVEPVEVDMFVNISSITDAFPWNHKLPRSQK
jgi:hypothetical protein